MFCAAAILYVRLVLRGATRTNAMECFECQSAKKISAATMAHSTEIFDQDLSFARCAFRIASHASTPIHNIFFHPCIPNCGLALFSMTLQWRMHIPRVALG
jgi:hypothetical protein